MDDISKQRSGRHALDRPKEINVGFLVYLRRLAFVDLIETFFFIIRKVEWASCTGTVFQRIDMSVIRRWCCTVSYGTHRYGCCGSGSWFLGLPDPYPLVRGTDPDPSIIKQKYF
jgi:hypothetical protein